jgi:hypothetical protein
MNYATIQPLRTRAHVIDGSGPELSALTVGGSQAKVGDSNAKPSIVAEDVFGLEVPMVNTE